MSDYSAREQHGWYMYDFAHSAFSTTVVTLFLGPYLTVLAKAAADAHGMVHPLHIDIDARSYWSYLISLSVILQVLSCRCWARWPIIRGARKSCLAWLLTLAPGPRSPCFSCKGTDTCREVRCS